MEGTVGDSDTAAALAREYADEECVGEFGEVTSVDHEDDVWSVGFTTHTFSEAFDHRVKVSREGNVYAHERST